MKLKVHPLFFAFGLYYAFTDKLLFFLLFTFTAVIHELGHSFVASKLGYKLNKIVLMPFGAVVKGDIDGLKVKDEIKIALAGPLTNIFTGLLILAVWWIFPTVYAFTDTAVFASFSIGLINLIPAYPLDGGRVLFSLLKVWCGSEKADKISKGVGVFFFLVLLGMFIYSVKNSSNFSLLFFSAFILLGVFDREKENKYVKIYSGVKTAKLKRGMPYNRFAVDKSVTVKKLISLLDENAINEITVYKGDSPIARLSQKDVEKIIENNKIYQKLENII